MTDQDRERLKNVLRRLTKTRTDETICLAYWEVKLLLEHIAEIKKDAY